MMQETAGKEINPCGRDREMKGVFSRRDAEGDKAEGKERQRARAGPLKLKCIQNWQK